MSSSPLTIRCNIVRLTSSCHVAIVAARGEDAHCIDVGADCQVALTRRLAEAACAEMSKSMKARLTRLGYAVARVELPAEN